jgi:hypothetical protein
MAYIFPELTTMGALFRFAAVLEQAALDTLELAETKVAEEAMKTQLSRLVAKRRRRVDELERARREKLNETVLEPLMDMPSEPYIPEIPADLDAVDGAELVALAAHIEGKTVSFYGDSIDKAGAVLAEVRRLFARFQKESVKNLETLAR